MDAYNDCLKSHRDDTEWLAIIDADEFIVPVGKFSLPKVLEEYKEYPGVGVNWVMFDYNKHIKKIPGGVLKNYCRCYKDYNTPVNRHIKSIVHPNRVKNMPNPHYCVYENNEFAVDENKNPIVGNSLLNKTHKYAFTQQNSITKLRINHYWSKSYEDVLQKIARGCADDGRKRNLTRDMYCFKDYTYDYCMYPYVIRMKPWLIIQETIKYIYYKIAAFYIKRYKVFYTSDEKKIKKSGLFDRHWYKKQYHIKAKEAIKHYLSEGWKLGYNPSRKFDTRAYLTANPDVKKANMCPLYHYLNWGKEEGRKAFPVKSR